jgi:hypothetical protein
MAVQMPALAGMVGNAVAGIKFQSSRDLHIGQGNNNFAEYIIARASAINPDYPSDGIFKPRRAEMEG